MSVSFRALGVPKPIAQVLVDQGFDAPFPIQEATIPDGLAGRDILGRASTGSGKTLAFGIPAVVNAPKAERRRPTALILTPTRELAEQIRRELMPVAKAGKKYIAAIYGGVGYGPQLRSLNQGVDLLVACPGRLEDLLDQGSLTLEDVSYVVIDEADRMADMGFLPAVRRLLDQTADERQTVLFSATLDGDVAVLTRDYQKDPVKHDLGGKDDNSADIRHHFWRVNSENRVDHTASIIHESTPSIVFCRTRRGADRLAKQLSGAGVEAAAIHGGRSQSQRDRALRAFSNGHVQALVATDVAARGIHVDGVASVVHFDPPEDSKAYVHRSGRTARAGESGIVVSLVMGDQTGAVRRIQRDLSLDVGIALPDTEDLEDGGTRRGDAPPSKQSRPSGGQRDGARRSSGGRNQNRGSGSSRRSGGQRSGGHRSSSYRSDDNRSNESRSERSNDGSRSQRSNESRPERSSEGRRSEGARNERNGERSGGNSSRSTTGRNGNSQGRNRGKDSQRSNSRNGNGNTNGNSSARRDVDGNRVRSAANDVDGNRERTTSGQRSGAQGNNRSTGNRTGGYRGNGNGNSRSGGNRSNRGSGRSSAGSGSYNG